MASCLARPLADFIRGLRYRDLPPLLVQWAKLNVLDALGICLHAGDLPWSRIVVEQIEELGGRQEATIIGHSERTSRLYAALANGTFAHGLEFDNAHWSHVHPGPPTISAALSIAEAAHSPGQDFLTAVVAGFEVALAIGKAIFPSHRYRGFQPTATVGTFGAAAAAGRILGLEEERLVNCLGLAGTQAAGLNEWIHSGDMSKRIHAGKAAMNGVLAALWAARGLTGPASVFEGADGFFKAYADETDPTPLERIGEEFELLKVWIKPYATCADFHSAIRLILQLQNLHGIAAEDVRRVRVGVDRVSKKYDSKQVETLLHAQMHYSVALAVVLLERDGFFEAFLRRYEDPRVRELAERVDVYVDPDVDRAFPQKWGCKVEILTKDGQRYEAFEEDRHPMTEEEIRDKFRRLARKKMNEETIEEIITTVDRLETLPDTSLLMASLRPKASWTTGA